MSDVELGDLTAVAEYYRARGKQAKFCKLVREASNACEADYDLGVSTRFVDQLIAADEDVKLAALGDFYHVARSALLGMAIITYGRATKTSNGSRGAVDLAPSLTGEFLADHQLIQNLRNDAIAHLGTGKRDHDEPWFIGTLLLKFDEGRPHGFGYRSVSIGTDNETRDRLHRLLPEAKRLIYGIAVDRQRELAEEILRIAEINPSFKKRVSETMFDQAQLAKTGLDAEIFKGTGGSVMSLFRRDDGL